MRAHFLTLGKQALIYGLSGAAIQALGLITLPIYSRAFTPAQYGIIELAGVTFAALIKAVDAGLGAAMQRNYFEVEDHAARRLVTSTATLSSFAIALPLAAALILAREPIAAWMFDDRNLAGIIVLVALSVVAGTFAIFLRDIMRLQFRPGHFAVSSMLTAGVAGVVGVVWVTAFEGGVTAVIAGALAGYATAAIYGLAIVHDEIGLRFSTSQLRSLLAFGLPLVPATAALWGIAFADRLVLSRLDGLASTGEYAVGTRFASVLLFVVGAFGTAYVPFMFSLNASDPERERALRAGLLTYASVVFVGISVAVTLFAREIADVIAPGYDRAYQVVGILTLGVAAFGLTPITSAGISIARRTQDVARYTGLVLVSNVALCFALIPLIGLVGAALATASSYIALAALYLWRSQQLVHADFHLGKVTRVFLLGAALMPLGLLQLGSEPLTLAVKLVATGAFVLALWPLGVMGEIESAELRQAMRAVRRSVARR